MWGEQQKGFKGKKLTQWSIHLKWPWCCDHRHHREATWWSAARKKNSCTKYPNGRNSVNGGDERSRNIRHRLFNTRDRCVAPWNDDNKTLLWHFCNFFCFWIYDGHDSQALLRVSLNFVLGVHWVKVEGSRKQGTFTKAEIWSDPDAEELWLNWLMKQSPCGGWMRREPHLAPSLDHDHLNHQVHLYFVKKQHYRWSDWTKIIASNYTRSAN